MNEFKPNSCKKKISRKKYILAIDNKDVYSYTTLARFFRVTHCIHAFLLEIDPHNNVFETSESKTQNKPENVSFTYLDWFEKQE